MAVELVRARNWPEEGSGLSWGALGGGVQVPKQPRLESFVSRPTKRVKDARPPSPLLAKTRGRYASLGVPGGSKPKKMKMPNPFQANRRQTRYGQQGEQKMHPALSFWPKRWGYASLGASGASKPNKNVGC